MKASIIDVQCKKGKPSSVNGQRVSRLLDLYRVWPKWWEGYAPRDYFLLEVELKTLEIYQCLDGWHLARTFD